MRMCCPHTIYTFHDGEAVPPRQFNPFALIDITTFSQFSIPKLMYILFKIRHHRRKPPFFHIASITSYFPKKLIFKRPTSNLGPFLGIILLAISCNINRNLGQEHLKGCLIAISL